MSDPNRFAKLGFEDFRRLAQDPGLSKFERIGFPDAYREGHEADIFADIERKLTNLATPGRRVLDIGPGCSDLPRMLIARCADLGHELHVIDSAEMLANLPEQRGMTKHASRFPDCAEVIAAERGRFDVILCYSVLHYVFVDVPLFRFVDAALSLLAPGGQMLVGDVPNISKRKRFFASENGVRFHQAFMQTGDRPQVEFNRIEADQIDDAVVLALVQHARAGGFDAYVVPQGPLLPMANRREDILFFRP